MGSKPRGLNPLSISPERLARLRALCLALPGASEKIAWGDPTWRVGDRIFAMQKGNVQGGRPSVWFKAEDGAQAMLIEAAPDRWFRPPYVGHKGWVGAYLDTDVEVDWDELGYLIEVSHRLIG